MPEENYVEAFYNSGKSITVRTWDKESGTDYAETVAFDVDHADKVIAEIRSAVADARSDQMPPAAANDNGE